MLQARPIKMTQPVMTRAFSSNDDVVKTLYIDGITGDNCDEDAIREHFSQYGEVVNVHFYKTPNHPTTRVFVDFEDADMAQAAANAGKDVEVAGEDLSVMLARSRNHPDSAKGRRDRTVYVGNLNYDTDEQSLEEFFYPAETKRVNIPKSPEGFSRGFAFVEFVNQEDATAAYERFGEELDGRGIQIKKMESKTRQSRDDRY